MAQKRSERLTPLELEIMNILWETGAANVDRAYMYKPAVTRPQFVSRHLGELVDRLFGGSAENLVMSLVEAKHLTPQTLARLNKLLKAQEEKEQ